MEWCGGSSIFVPQGRWDVVMEPWSTIVALRFIVTLSLHLKNPDLDALRPSRRAVTMRVQAGDEPTYGRKDGARTDLLALSLAHPLTSPKTKMMLLQLPTRRR